MVNFKTSACNSGLELSGPACLSDCIFQYPLLRYSSYSRLCAFPNAPFISYYHDAFYVILSWNILPLIPVTLQTSIPSLKFSAGVIFSQEIILKFYYYCQMINQSFCHFCILGIIQEFYIPLHSNNLSIHFAPTRQRSLLKEVLLCYSFSCSLYLEKYQTYNNTC